MKDLIQGILGVIVVGSACVGLLQTAFMGVPISEPVKWLCGAAGGVLAYAGYLLNQERQARWKSK